MTQAFVQNIWQHGSQGRNGNQRQPIIFCWLCYCRHRHSVAYNTIWFGAGSIEFCPCFGSHTYRESFPHSTSFFASAIFLEVPPATPNAGPSATNPIIAVSNLVKQFGRFAALRGVTAEFAAGKLYAILGDNGAGKTTLLRSIAGLTPPTRGTISVLGTTNLRDVCAQIGYMAHASLLYDEMSGMENLRYFAQLYGIRDDRRCAEVIQTVKLDPELNRPVGQYSQGMRQRMSLARALLSDPRILLLDEPFSNVDLSSGREMVRLLKTQRESGKTIFVVTHQAGLLSGAADEFVFMQAGQIVSRTRELPAEAP
jgi:ABC-type Na+ transport system ATPase subunit NatA